MGGCGSGRHWHYDAASTTSDYRSIDVRRWKREGLLEPGRFFGWQWTRDGEVTGSIRAQSLSGRVVLTYRSRSYDNEWKDHEYPVYLDWTPCNFGGERVWFLCPAKGCGRRVAKLYGGEIFACRQCYRLAYPSQRENVSDRAARRADRIRERLDWPAGIFNGSGWGKPKGMHWKTYERLVEEHDAYVEHSCAAMMPHLLKWL